MGNKRIVIAGDLLPSGSNIYYFEKGDVSNLFGEKICKIFAEADFSILNLEGPLTDSINKADKVGPTIKAPQKCINGIRALGTSAVTLANNHITDYGNQGYFDTEKVLKENGIASVGAGPNDSEIKKYISISLGRRKVCIYNVSETFFNEPGKQTAGANLYDEYIVCNEIKELRKVHDYLIVIYHGGAEYLPYPSPLVRKRFHRMADSGADFITAQHTHCIGCEEYYNNSYLLYGQGNFLFARQKKYPEKTKQGLLVEIVFKNNMEIIKHLVKIENNVIRYDNDQDFSGFNKRSSLIDDKELIDELYKEIKSDDILYTHISAAKGKYPMRRIIRKLFPQYYKKTLGKNYTKEQLMFNMNVVKGERRKEDMFYVWNYLLDNLNKD